MDGRLFTYYLLRHPELAGAVMSLVNAETAAEAGSKHFKYVADGATEGTAELLRRLAQAMLTAGEAPADRCRRPARTVVVVKLADGWELRSGVYEADEERALTCGEWVSMHRPDGHEYAYWDAREWRDEPALVMGAIINSAAGYRVLDKEDQAAIAEKARVAFTTTATAQIREHWATNVPTEALEDIASLREYLDEQLRAGNCDITGDDQTIGDEQDRDIEDDSLERVFAALATDRAEPCGGQHAQEGAGPADTEE